LEYSEYRAALEMILNLSKDQINVIEKYEKLLQYMSIKVYIRVKNNTILAILDIGAYILVITKLLAVALGLK